MKNLLKKLIKLSNSSQNSIQPLITISISRSALINNLNEFKRVAPDHHLAPVLKSNAYGHGISLIANELEKENLPFYVIDSYFEAIALRNEGIKTPLLIIGYVRPENIESGKLKNITYVISSLDSLRLIKSETLIHLKLDTGMHRQGILPEEKAEAIKIIKDNPNIKLEGICSHFADTSNPNETFTGSQIALWNESVEYFKKEFPALKYWHISATGGHRLNGIQANLSRLGLGLYGLTEMEGLNLIPVLEMKTIITGIKKIHKGDCVGYDCTFTANSSMTIATLPVGYYEGMNIRLANKGLVMIKDSICPIIGKVSMNITTIDISNKSSVKVGDEVIVISRQKESPCSIEAIAKLCDSIPYEIAVRIPAQLKRIIID